MTHIYIFILSPLAMMDADCWAMEIIRIEIVLGGWIKKLISHLGVWQRRNTATVEMRTRDMLTSRLCWRNIPGEVEAVNSNTVFILIRVVNMEIWRWQPVCARYFYRIQKKIRDDHAFSGKWYVLDKPVLLAWDTFFLLLLILDFSLLKLVRILKFRRRRNVKGKTPKTH